MRLRWFLILSLAAAALAGTFWLLRRSPEPAPAPVEQPVPEVPTPKPPEPDPDPEPLETEEEPVVRTENPTEPEFLDQGSIEFPGAKIETEIDEKAEPVKLHGTLVDENTNLPLPDFELEFEVVGEGTGPYRKVSTRTDAEGKFECSEPILVARCVVRFLDRPGHKRVPPPWTVGIEDVRKTEIHLVVPWGPIYRLAFAPKEPIQPENVEVRLRCSGPRRGSPVTTDWEPVHSGEPAWARFQPLLGGSGKVEKLEARTRDGLWEGEADAEVASGLAPGVTLVTFEQRAVLEGIVVDAEKVPQADIDVRLEAKDADEKPVKRRARTGADGHYRFEQLPACIGELSVLSVRHAPWKTGVTLLAGKVQELPIALDPLPIAGAIALRVESESGLYAPAFTVVLTIEDDPVAAVGGARFVRHLRAKWHEEGGRKVADFRFPDLPKHNFQIELQKDDFFSWEPPRLTLQPPAENARVLIRDGIPNASLAFRVKDAQSGEAIPRFALTLEFPGAHVAPRQLGARSGHSFLEHYPLDRPLRWRVSCRGYAPMVGDLGAFQVSEKRSDGELRVCELELHPGWGESYRFVDARSRLPLAGIQLLLDGVESGKSDARGFLLARSAVAPQRIEYRCDALGIPVRPLRAERSAGCSMDVRVGPGKPPKGDR